MKHKIKLLKQTTEFGCLATCYSMIKNYLFGEEEFNQNIEADLTKEAFRSETGFNEHFYLKKLNDLGCEIKIIVETPYMEEAYKQLNTKLGCNSKIEYEIVGVSDYLRLLNEGYLIITLIDLWDLDMIIHFSHYVIVNGFEEDSFFVLDPKYGKELKFSKERLSETLNKVKDHLGYSRVLFAIKKPQIY